ncbi:uncharacterized protein [Aquarana catesbeiana]|uniref:uncharacterized protein isoform X3 n=1 Tax=Aquarana catesbeiana TaxID=8400 RepID=UPI003CCA05E1
MAERTILGILILLSLCQTYAALDVSAPSTQRALFTRDTILICFFSVDKTLDLNFLIILWTFRGKVILRYDNKVFSTQDPRMSLNMESLGDGYASLHISNVTISDRGTYMCTVIYNAERKEKEISLKVFAKPLLSIQSTKVQRNTENTLTCKATGFFPPDILITWYRKGEALRNYSMGKPELYKDGMYQVNSTMTIIPTEDDQNQTFSCKVQHDSLQEPLQKDFQLFFEDIETSSNVVTVVCIILALMTIIGVGIGIFWWRQKYRKKGVFTVMDIEGPTKLIAGEETIIICRATNCPENTSVTWLEEIRGQVYEIPEYHGGDNEEEERLMDTQYGIISCKDGPNYISSLKFRPSVTNHKDVTFTCRYSCGDEKKEKTFHCRAIYDIGVFTVMDIEGPTNLIAGEETIIICRATNCPENTSVTWLEEIRGQVYEIPESHGGDNKQEEILMDTQYGVISCREGPNFTSSLKFRPNVTNHKDVTFTCRYSCGEEKKEKTFHCRAIYAKPQLVQPISRSLIVSVLKYLVTLENFYPRNITIRWTQGIGEPQEALSSTETFTDIPDGTSNVHSEVTIPEELLKDPEFRVRVSWEHESLDTPGYKDLSIRDPEYPWNPVVEEIQTPNIFHDTPVTLKCYISKYFPDDITVTWLRKSKNQEICEETDNMVSNTITSRREDDNTYSCTASLTINPTLSVHQGAEYFCRVDHPSLERPIERRTKSLIIKDLPWRPQVGEIKIPNLEEDNEDCCNIL